ncbi:hypothetical protein FI667_g11682, partial [Globisporangium splendens]
MASTDLSPFVLTSAVVVCQQRDSIEALPHVLQTISEFADASAGFKLAEAAAKGNLQLVQRVHAMQEAKKKKVAGECETNTTSRRTPVDTTCNVELAIEAAAAHGHLHIVQWLHHTFPNRKCTWAIEIAAERGHLDIMTWLHANSSIDRTSMAAMDEAARHGHLEVVKWLHANRSEGCTTRAMDCAAQRGRLELVQWLHANRQEGCTTQAMDWAARQGHLDVVMWLHQNRPEGCTSMAIDGAASNGHLHVVMWLHETCKLKWTHNATRNAAKHGHDHVVAWLELQSRLESVTDVHMSVPQTAVTSC